MDTVSDASFSDKELIAAFIEKRISDNLAVFKENVPNLYDRFESYQEERFFVIYDEFGAVNLLDRDEKRVLYGSNPVKECLDNLDSYIDSPIQRPFYIAPKGDDKPDPVNYVHTKALNSMGKEQLSVLEGVAKDIRLALVSRSVAKKVSGVDFDKSNDSLSIGSLPSFLNTVFWFSTGLGFDLERMYLDRDVKHLIIVEPSFDVFYASLQFVDWVSIIKKSTSMGFDISFIIDDDYDHLLNDVASVVSSIGRHNVSGAYFYSGFYLPEYSKLFESIKSAVSYSYLSGFGFYDDSRYSLSHTIGNINKNVPMLASNKNINKKHGQEKLPVFIVGNGPSLDAELGFIKDRCEEAVVVSCGSALPALISNGIIPDFHAELERTATVTHWIKKSGDLVDGFFDAIKEVKLIIASQVHPEIVDMFECAGSVLKDTELGSSFVYNAYPGSGVALVPRLAPTCVHIAFTSMVLMGFRDIYLFGTDMGSADVSKHHSKFSNYSHLKKDIEQSFVFSKSGEVYESNFDDKEIYSSGLYPMFKRELENIVKGWKLTIGESLSVYNCSDGALIAGADPLKSKDIDIDNCCPSKKEIVDKVFSSHFSFVAEDIQSIDVLLELSNSQVAKACDYAISMIEVVNDRKEAFLLVDRFAVDFHSSAVLPDEHAWLYSIFDGSLLYAFSVMNSTLMLPVDEGVAIDAFNRQMQHLRTMFEDIKEDFDKCALNWDKESNYSDFVS